MVHNGIVVAVKLRPGKHSRVRVVGQASIIGGEVVVMDQVEINKGNGYVVASDTWQEILAFGGREAVASVVAESGAAFVL